MSNHHRTSASRTRAETPSPARTITNAIIAKLEAGTSPWRKPWASANDISRPMRACGKPYRGINTIWLWSVGEDRGYTIPTWMTYNQAQEFGGQVRKGERGTIAIFYKSYGKTESDPATGEETTSARRVLRTYSVFNVAQIDGLPDRFVTPPAPRSIPDEQHRAEIDAFITASRATIISGGSRACYIPGLDVIQMPAWQDFESYAHYGAVAAHELSHWTGHKSRLDRDLRNGFGSKAYAAEELVAELSSAILGADLGLPVTHLDNHASYIASWLDLLRDDERALLTAAARAEAASDYLLGLMGRGEGVADDDHEPLAIAA